MSPEKKAMSVFWSHPGFFLLHALADAVWIALALSWFWLPDSKVWGLALAAVELLFSQQDKWAFVDKPLEPLIAATRPAGLTHDQAMACLKDQAKADAMLAVEKRATDEIKMTGTPTFVIDGKIYGGELSIDQLKAILDPIIKK